MANKMLVDATHPEETRVVVVRGSRVEEFDFEAASKKQLRGNIYLAKVTRVEPSLQAAFVDYGGNRHGFLAFAEIHPDYYQIPFADRQALLEEEARYQSEVDRDEGRPRRPSRGQAAEVSDSDDSRDNGNGDDDSESEAEEDQVDVVGSEDALEEVPERRSQQRMKRHYKIQEVIKRRQVLLVQVVKEERGNKGAALTTYLSLAGRYSVLMPNTARGGGISRKITSIPDRKRLKVIAQELEVPEGMGVIVRTAGAARTKTEIKRDFEYLLRLWENVRELTLQSTAPKLVYEEGSLIKRSIRDLYNKDIDEILVAGDDGYREAKDFMRMLMPSHAKNVQAYREPSPIFTRFAVESQLDAMFSPQVTLRSGGYIVINQTEALVSIDVNSGKSTREHNIEDTALATNMEAAEEVSRQLRLRDLAGLVVIDFIDMEEKRNNRSVERKLKDCLKNDRARIQVGRISHFGLMEMSRQRIRTGVLESSMVVCQHCGGTGLVRSTESVALHVLRSLEENLIRGVTHDLTVRTRTAVTLYILNQKRAHLFDLERRFGLTISILADDHAVMSGHLFSIEKGEPVTARVVPVLQPALVTPESVVPDYDDTIDDNLIEDEEVEEIEEEVEVEGRSEPRSEPRGEARRDSESDGNARRKRRRRRRGRGRTGEFEAGAPREAVGERAPAAPGDYAAEQPFDGDDEGPEAEDAETDTETETEAEAQSRGEDAGGERGGPRKRRRRGRRGGRRNRREGEPGFEAGSDAGFESDVDDEGPEGQSDETEDAAEAAEVHAEPVEAPVVETPDFVLMDRETLAAEVEVIRAEEAAKPKKPRAPRKPRVTKKAAAEAAAAEAAAAEAAGAASSEPADVTPVIEAAPIVEPVPVVVEAVAEAVVAEPVVAEPVAPAPVEPPPPPKPEITSTEIDPSKPKRSGWWSKKGTN
ncbi:MAG: ribonuclease E/G [Ancalomicrobiaceae bacterium]|nr:ribonuclease E/G [Ancalomicrobiaceae bacterium]